MSSNESSSGGNSFASAVGSLAGAVFQFDLLNNRAVIKSIQDLTHSQHRSGVHTFEQARKMKLPGDTSDYQKVLMYKGYRITPLVRNELFRRVLASDRYSDLNPFERGLTNWILEEKPYEKDVEPPPPPPLRVLPQAKRNFLIACGIGAPVALIICAAAAASMLPFLAGIIAVTIAQTLSAVKNTVIADPNTLWIRELEAKAARGAITGGETSAGNEGTEENNDAEERT